MRHSKEGKLVHLMGQKLILFLEIENFLFHNWVNEDKRKNFLRLKTHKKDFFFGIFNLKFFHFLLNSLSEEWKEDQQKLRLHQLWKFIHFWKAFCRISCGCLGWCWCAKKIWNMQWVVIDVWMFYEFELRDFYCEFDEIRQEGCVLL